MKIYVGYSVFDYATPLCMGLDKKSVQKTLDSYNLSNSTWIEEYNLDSKTIIEFDSD